MRCRTPQLYARMHPSLTQRTPSACATGCCCTEATHKGYSVYLKEDLSTQGYEVHQIGGTGRSALKGTMECTRAQLRPGATTVPVSSIGPWEKPQYVEYVQEEDPGVTSILTKCSRLSPS